jgi:molybdate transport system substrate-binding protein
MNTRPRIWLVAGIVAALSGCGRGPDRSTADHDGGGPESVVVFAAASTKDALQEIAIQFTDETKVRVKINADDSAKLAMQIAQDAPAHLFLSANEKWADFVVEKGFAQTANALLGNTLVIVVPKGNPAKIAKPADLTGPDVKRIALAGPKVPAGIYARQALKKLELWDSLEEAKKTTAAENVRVALTYVERNECEAGIVYGTDAKVSNRIELVYTFDAAAHDPIRYPLVLTQDGQKLPGARAFHDFLRSPTAAKVFQQHGFTVLDGK